MGNPVAHSRSPWIHARFAELTGQPLRYERQLAPLDGFAATCAPFAPAAGAAATSPCRSSTRPRPGHLAKQRAWRWPAPPTPCSFDGEDIRAYNTDGPGLVADITRNAGVRWPGATCC
jgi:shikimate dehydrogenase